MGIHKNFLIKTLREINLLISWSSKQSKLISSSSFMTSLASPKILDGHECIYSAMKSVVICLLLYCKP